MTFRLAARGVGDCKKRYRPQRLSEIVPTFSVKEAKAILENPNSSQVWLFEGLTGCGKCLGEGTLVLMADGHTIPVEQVRDGDRLMGPDGNARVVTSTTRGRGPLYRIEPVKGEPWVCNDVHILTLIHTVTGKTVDIALDDYLKQSDGFKHRHKLFTVGIDAFENPPPYVTQIAGNLDAAAFASLRTATGMTQKVVASRLGVRQTTVSRMERGVMAPSSPVVARIVALAEAEGFEGDQCEPLPASIDPYFLGVWFGDGSRSTHRLVDGDTVLHDVRVSKPDPEIHAICEKVAREWGLRVKTYGESSNPTHALVGLKGRHDNKLLYALRNLIGPGVLIPDAIIRGPRNLRLEFLAGFLDTDGHLSKNCFNITQKREDWARAIWFIARSLGLRAIWSTRTVKGYEHKGLYYRVSISGDTDMIPTRIPRKQASPRRQKKNALRTGFKVVPVGDGDYYGFTLTGDGRFLLGDFTVTHNTTLARIISRACICTSEDPKVEKPCLECESCKSMEHQPDFTEINVAAFGGKDSVKAKIAGMCYLGTYLKRRIYIFDECFWGKTLVQTVDGPREIQSIKIGDKVFSRNGLGAVNHVFKNTVPLSRVVRLDLSNGTTIFTTREHRFWTDSGWQEAQDLRANSAQLLGFRSKLLNEIIRTQEGNDQCEELRVLREGLQAEKAYTARVQQIMRTAFAQSPLRAGAVGDPNLPRMQPRVHGQKEESETLLQSNLRSEKQNQTSRNSARSLERRDAQEDCQRAEEIRAIKGGRATTQATQSSHENLEPLLGSRSSSEDARNQAPQRHTTYVGRNTRREWSLHRTPDEISGGIGLGNGTGYTHQAEKPLSNLLQGRRRKRPANDCSRSRWQKSPQSQGEGEGQEENRTPRELRVDRFEVYQQGSNDRSFEGVIGDQERRQGFIEFYDLEMDGHPSYFANGVCVHNCHQLSSQAQELLNKVLEEPVGDTLIFLCTTKKKGLKRTLLGRCAKLNFRRMTRVQFQKIVTQICEDAGQPIPDDTVAESLFHKADGSVRDLLNLMDKVLLGSYRVGIGFEAPSETGSPNMMGLVDALKKKNWAHVRKVLLTDNVKNEPEGYRQTVCDFLRRDLLRKRDIDLPAASALGLLAGSLEDEPKNEQYNLFVLKCMRVCYKK